MINFKLVTLEQILLLHSLGGFLDFYFYKNSHSKLDMKMNPLGKSNHNDLLSPLDKFHFRYILWTKKASLLSLSIIARQEFYQFLSYCFIAQNPASIFCTEILGLSLCTPHLSLPAGFLLASAMEDTEKRGWFGEAAGLRVQDAYFFILICCLCCICNHLLPCQQKFTYRFFKPQNQLIPLAQRCQH